MSATEGDGPSPTARLGPVTLDGEPELEALLASTPQRRGRPLNLFTVLGHNPPVLKAWSRMGYRLLSGRIPGRECEIVVLRTGWLCASEYEFAQHRSRARHFGLTDEDLVSLAGADVGEGGWTADEVALITMCDELCAANDVTEPTWAALAARWDEGELVELVTLCGFYRMVSGFLNACRVPLDPGLRAWSV